MRTRNRLVTIGGGTSSGKTTLARKVAEELGEKHCVLVEGDWYYRHRSDLTLEQRRRVNYDHMDAIEWSLFRSDLQCLLEGKIIRTPRYDFCAHLRYSEAVITPPRPVIIAEGILILCDEDIREMTDFSFYVDTDDDERVLRRIEKDMGERGRTFEESVAQYRATVKPMHDLFCYPSRRHANLIVPNGGGDAKLRKFLNGGFRSIIQNDTDTQFRTVM